MRIILFLSSLLCLSNCFAQEFEIVSATAQKWAGGQKRTGHGVYYTITLKVKKNSQRLSFDKLWVGSEFYSIKAYKHIESKNIESYNINDTIYVSARSQIRPPDEENPEVNQKTVTEAPPFEIKGAALLGYLYKGKRKYKTIDSFKELNSLFYP